MKALLACGALLAALLPAAGCATSSPGSALRHAAHVGDLATVRFQLDAGVEVDEQVDGGGETALKLAAMGGQAAIVKLLIERGADIDLSLSLCEDTEQWGKENSNTAMRNEGRQCQFMLRRLKAEQDEQDEAKRREAETARAQAIEAQRIQQMKEMLQAAVAAAAKTQKDPGKPAAVRSDIDNPEFSASERIMDDDDLAVIIGIEGYQNLPKSDYSYDDAKLVKDYVKALGFKERNIELLLDEKATRSSLEKTLEVWLRNKVKPTSRVFVYYSGHGAPDPATGKAYLVPYDGDPNYLAVTGYPLERLYEDFRRLPAVEAMIVLDSCFSGAGGRSVLAKGARPLVTTTTALPVPGNVAVLTATQDAQISTSSPEKGHGIFTYYFLKAVKEGKGRLADIYEQIKPQVEDEAKQLNVQQSPSLSVGVQAAKRRFELRK